MSVFPLPFDQRRYSRPSCPNCGNNMWLIMAEELIPGQQNRTFWCKVCKTQQTLSLPPTPERDQHPG